MPRLLKEKVGYDWVSVESNLKGLPIYQDNPYIDHLNVIETSASLLANYPVSFWEKRAMYLKKEGNFDLLIWLRNSIEYGYIAMEDMAEYFLSSAERRAL